MKTIVFSANRYYSTWIIETYIWIGKGNHKQKNYFEYPKIVLSTFHVSEIIWSFDVKFSQLFNLKRIYRLLLGALPQNCTLKNVLLTSLQIPIQLGCILMCHRYLVMSVMSTKSFQQLGSQISQHSFVYPFSQCAF